MRFKPIFNIICLSVMTFTPILGHGGTNDDITNACYATNHCGARSNLKTLAAVLGATQGAKIGFFTPISGGTIMGGYAGYVIGDNLGGKLSTAYSANEYIYFDDKTCLECDTYQMGEHYECPNGTIVSNGSHVLKCHTTSGGDYWQEYTLSPCSNSPIKSKDTTGTYAEIRATVNKPVASGVNVYSGDACLYITKSKSTSNDNNPKKETPVKQNSTTSLQKCLDQRTTDEGRACCYVPNSVATWNGNKCVCTDNTQVFDITTHSCITASADITVIVQTSAYVCSVNDLTQLYMWRDEYLNNNAIVNLIDKILLFCTTGENRTGTDYNNMIAQLRALISQENAIAQKLQESAAQSRIVLQNKSAMRISETIKKINTQKSDFERTVWKTEDGKFNSTRLLSDSVAGVVLGTAGGLITSNVIKKNQVANGFEDIQCTVGGQVVAGWGDQFRVGIN